MSALKILTQLVLRDLVKQKNLMLEFVGEAKKGIASLENLPILLKQAQAKASKLLQDAKSRGVDLTNLSADEIKKTYQFSKEVGHQKKMSITKPKVDMAETVKSEVIDFKGWNPKVIKGGKKEGIESASNWIERRAKEEGIDLTKELDEVAQKKITGGKTFDEILTEDKGVGNLFKETKKVDLPEGVNWKDTSLPVNPKVESFYDELVENAYKESKKTGRDVKTIIEETIDYKFTGNETGKEILDIIEKKFFKADGGRIGYDAGGLTGQAKNIYDSWISAGHSSQDALDYLSSKGMYDAGGGGIESIINTQQSIIPGADGRSSGIGIQTPIGQNISNFQSAINTRQNRLNNPGKIAEFAYSMGMPKQASVNELLARGMRGPRDTTLMSNIPFGISGLISKALPDMYGDMTLADQITTQAYMGYTDPNTNMANKDPFGINVRSAFGNYAEKAAEIVDTLNAKALRNDGYLSDYDKQRLNHYRNVTQTKQSAAADLGLIEIAKQEKAKQEAAKAAAQLAGVSELTGNVQTGGGKGIASSGVASGSVDPSGMGGGSMQAKSSGAQDTGRTDGGWGWAHGGPVGLATMFTRRR